MAAKGRPTKSGFEPLMTLSEVAAVMGLSRARIGQIEQAALAKLRAECDRRGLSFAELFHR